MPGYLASNGYKHLSEFTTAFAALPNIAAYLASGRRLPITVSDNVSKVPAGSRARPSIHIRIAATQ